MSPRPRDLRAALVQRLEESRVDARRLESLAVAVDENTRLASLLEPHIAELEQAVAGLLSGERP